MDSEEVALRYLQPRLCVNSMHSGSLGSASPGTDIWKPHLHVAVADFEAFLLSICANTIRCCLCPQYPVCRRLAIQRRVACGAWASAVFALLKQRYLRGEQILFLSQPSGPSLHCRCHIPMNPSITLSSVLIGCYRPAGPHGNGT